MKRTFATLTMLIAGILTLSLPNGALAELTFGEWATAEGGTAQLLAQPALLSEGEGLGGQIVQRLTGQDIQVKTTRGNEAVTPTHVLEAASTCARVVVLLAKDTERLPGTLRRDTTAEYVSATGVSASKVTTLVVQPGPNGHGLSGLDARTVACLAEHIVQEMASC